MLTSKQLERLQRYLDMWRERFGMDPEASRCVFDLNQNPVKRTCWSSKKGEPPTITTKSHRMWIPMLRRWLLPIEVAFAHGFPVTPGAARDACCERDPLGDSSSFQVLGNCMHMSNVGSVLAIALSSISRV